MDSSVIKNKQASSLFWRTLPPLSAPLFFGSKMLVKPKDGCINANLSADSGFTSQGMLILMETEGCHAGEELNDNTVIRGINSMKQFDTQLVCKSCGLNSCTCTTSSLFTRIHNNLLSKLNRSSFLDGRFQGEAVQNFHFLTDTFPKIRPSSFDLVKPSNQVDHCRKLSSKLASAFELAAPGGTNLHTSKIHVLSSSSFMDALYSNLPLSFEIPFSLNLCEELKAEHCPNRKECNDFAGHLHSDITPCVSGSNLSSCLKKMKTKLDSTSDACEANQSGEASFLRQPKNSCVGNNFSRKLRILCRRKNSLKIKHSDPRRIIFKKRCVFRMDAYGDATVVSTNPGGFHTAHLSSFFMQPSELEVSHDCVCSDQYNCDDGSSIFLMFDAGRMFKRQYQQCAANVKSYFDGHWGSLKKPSSQTTCSRNESFHCKSGGKNEHCDLSLPDCDDSDNDDDEIAGIAECEEDDMEGIIFRSDMSICYDKNGQFRGSRAKTAVVSQYQILKETNARWSKFYKSSTEHFPANVCSTRGPKMVQFCEETSLVAVLNEVEWADDYAAARRGSWVQDRMHFDRRIKETEKLIGWVFGPSHRAKLISSLEN